MNLLLVLTQFLYRLSAGLAGAMALTDPRKVTSGFYRNHLYVTLGLNVLAALVAWNSDPDGALYGSRWMATVGATLSYVGAICWLYEAAGAGRALLLGVTVVNAIGAVQTGRTFDAETALSTWRSLAWQIDPLLAAWLLGAVFTAMLLGHWYLNTPGMELAPLRRLLILGAIGCGLRGVVWLACLAAEWSAAGGVPPGWPFWVLHGGAGIFGTLGVLAMTWETLKIPNTQSATGILYVGVILTFLGETAGQLISQETLWPL
ncbi:MAG: hypothetical protein QM811_25200 [Pirellulales bacterium]